MEKYFLVKEKKDTFSSELPNKTPYADENKSAKEVLRASKKGEKQVSLS
jgi:hypothetical protein